MDNKTSRGLWLGLLRKWFPKLKTPPTYIIVEVEKGIKVSHEVDAAAIASLKDHPGIIALQNRLRLQKALLKSRLETTRHKELRDVDFLQSSIFGLGLLESEINTAVEGIKAKQAPRVASFNEMEEFEKVRAAIEGVGSTRTE